MVLPLPDSPTRPTVSPSRTESETPSTARTWPTVRRRTPRRMGKWTRKASVSATTGASGAAGAGRPRGSVSSSIRV